MNHLHTKLKTLRAAQTALREALYDFQDTLLDQADGAEHHCAVKDLLEEAEKHMGRLEHSTGWVATYIN